MLTLIPMMRICVLLIVRQLIQFSRVIHSLSCLVMRDINVNIIYIITNIFEGSEKAIILLPRKLNRNLLSFKDICLDEYHIETNNKKDIKDLCITMIEL